MGDDLIKFDLCDVPDEVFLTGDDLKMEIIHQRRGSISGITYGKDTRFCLWIPDTTGCIKRLQEVIEISGVYVDIENVFEEIDDEFDGFWYDKEYDDLD